MRWFKILILAILVSVLGFGLFNLLQEKRKLAKEAESLREIFNTLERENKNLSARIEYFKNPENLLKELKSQFNYREADEGLIIIVPNATGTRD